MMKLTIVVSSISRAGGGVSESVRLLAGALLHQDGYDIEVVTLKDAHYDADVVTWQGVTVHGFRYYGPKNYGFSPGMLWHMLRCRADVVHVHGLWMFHCLCVLAWSLLRRGAYVVTPHGMLEPWILTRSRTLKKWVSVLYQSWFLRRASAFHILTPKEASDVAQSAPGGRTVVIPNFTPLLAPLPTRPPWWKPAFADRKVFLFFGRINDKKGWRELCTAWAQACTADAGFSRAAQLVFCGWLDDAPDFSQHIERLAASHGNVCFAGPQFNRHKQETLEAASVFILPSKSEGLPMVVLEAWAAGVPVLMTAACNLPIGFAYGAAREIAQDVDGIGHGITAAVSWSPAVVAQMAAAGRRLVREKFSKEIVATEMSQLYRSVVA